MKKTILAIAAAATIVAGTFAAPTGAEARSGRNAAIIGRCCRRRHHRRRRHRQQPAALLRAGPRLRRL